MLFYLEFRPNNIFLIRHFFRFINNNLLFQPALPNLPHNSKEHLPRSKARKQILINHTPHQYLILSISFF